MNFLIVLLESRELDVHLTKLLKRLIKSFVTLICGFVWLCKKSWNMYGKIYCKIHVFFNKTV